jgi:hypothetical protein
MLTRKADFEKQEHDLTFTLELEDQPRGRLNPVLREISSAILQSPPQRLCSKNFAAKGFSCDTARLNKGGINVSDLHRGQRMAAWHLEHSFG